MKLLISILFTIVLFTGCMKEKPFDILLPPATSSGQNSLGFIINNRIIWTNVFERFDMFGSNSYDTHAQCYLQYTNDSIPFFSIRGGMYLKNRHSEITYNSDFFIDFYHAAFSSQVYLFDTTNQSRVFFQDYLSGRKYYNIPNSFTFSVNYIDTTRHIISGTFLGTLYYFNNSGNANDSMKITDGRFDLNYSRL